MIIRTYVSAFFLASCMFVAVPSQAIDSNENNLAELSSDVQAERSLFVRILISPYVCLKRLFGKDVTVKPVAQQDVVVQEILGDSKEAAKSEQASPTADPVADDGQPVRIIKIINDDAQSLDVCVSYASDNDDSTHRFSVPSHSYSLISQN